MKCKWCNEEINIDKIGKYASGDFCSILCSRLYSRSKVDDVELKDGNCNVCGKPLKIKKRASKKLVKCDKCRKTPKFKPKNKKRRYCLNCGEENKKNFHFCCKQCKDVYNKKFSSPYKRGYPIEDILDGKYPKYGSSKLRIRLIKEGYKKHKCEICGLTEWNKKPIQLILDHIDGNSYNHKLENLRILCPNCDAQLPTYCGKNAGNGRLYRRMKYHKDKNRI